MSEQEQEVVQTEEIVEQEPKQEQAEPSKIEERALALGWKPKDQFSGDEDDFIDAKEFVRRQPLFDKIQSQSNHLKNVTRALNELKEHYTKVNEAAYTRAINDLKAQRKDALSNGDGDRFEQIDDKIKEAEQEREALSKINTDIPEVEPQTPPEFQSWKSKNTWYDNVGYMRSYADQVGITLHKRGLSPSEVLKEVEKAVKAEFPQKFRNPNKDNAVSVETGGNASRKAAGDSVVLSDMERKIMNDFVRMGVMTKEDYIKDLKQVKGRA
jgi:hypothetical protein